MALQKTYNKFGMDFTNAYHKIDDLVISKRDCRVSISIYADSENMEVLEYKNIIFAYDDALGTLSSVYNYLKTLPAYTGAVDV